MLPVVSCSVLTEWVNLPGDPGPAALSEVVCQEPQPERHVVDDGGVVGRGLVVHAPPAPDKLQPPRLHQLPHRVLHSLALLPPPAPEEGGLDVDKSSLLINIHLCNYFMVGLLQANKNASHTTTHFIRKESLDHTVNNVLYPGPLDVVPN